MSFYDRFRQPGGDLASFFRSLTTPTTRRDRSAAADRHEPTAYEWELLRARQGGTKRLDFFDANLRGSDGAQVVLGELERSPAASSISLSQNELGDDGVRELLVGMKRLRSNDTGSYLQEINLSSCGISDVALYLITLHLLQPSPHPPSITHLYLTGNRLSLALASLPEFLGKTLSSPASSVRCLSLTNNPSIGTKGVVALLPHLRLAQGPSHLSQLHLSVCNLTPDAAEPLARWLEDPNGGARLQVLAVNGCNLGQAGVRRIARAVTSGKASSLIHFECLANDDIQNDDDDDDPERWTSVVRELESTESERDRNRRGGWKERLGAATERNKAVHAETRLAALALVSTARILFGGNAREAAIDVSEIVRDVDATRPGARPSCADLLAPSDTRIRRQPPFPFLRLPIELQVHVLRCHLLVKPSRLAHLYPPLDDSPGEAPSSSRAVLDDDDDDASLRAIGSSPLTESQFLRILSHCANRSTLETEIRIVAARSAGTAPSLNHDAARAKPAWARQQSDNADGQGAGDAWEEWYLRSTGCDRFERAGSLRCTTAAVG